MLIIVDGTGPYDYDQYKKDFAHSFCSQLFNQNTASSKYYSGPGTLGVSTRSTANNGCRDVIKSFESNPKEKIYLAGYSRGGAAVMQIAKWCARSYVKYDVKPATGYSYSGIDVKSSVVPIPIQAMFLLDPVDRDLALDPDGIPSNVKHCYVMYRDQSIVEFNPPLKLEEWRSWVDKGLCIGSRLDPDRYARKFMSNALVAPEKGNTTTKFTIGFYDGSTGVRNRVIANASHGAVGGLPWPERQADEEACKSAASALNSWLKNEGLPISVSMHPYSAATLKQYPPMSDNEIRAMQARLDAAEWQRMQNHDRYSSKF